MKVPLCMIFSSFISFLSLFLFCVVPRIQEAATRWIYAVINKDFSSLPYPYCDHSWNLLWLFVHLSHSWSWADTSLELSISLPRSWDLEVRWRSVDSSTLGRGRVLNLPRRGDLPSKALYGPVTSCWMSGRVNLSNAYHCGMSPLWNALNTSELKRVYPLTYEDWQCLD